MDGCKPVQYDVEDGLLSMQLVPPLHFADKPQGTAGLQQFGANAVAGAAKRRLKVNSELP